MTDNTPAYGLWALVIFNSAIFLMFAFSFTKPQTARDWRTFSAFAAFIVALFVEMYGFPLSLYLLSSAWNVLYHAQRSNTLAQSGPYARIRHPQYVAFVLILFGFLLQWSMLLTLAMFPILLIMYGRLAITEEKEMRVRFGSAFDRYADATPRFPPRMRQGPAAGCACQNKGYGMHGVDTSVTDRRKHGVTLPHVDSPAARRDRPCAPRRIAPERRHPLRLKRHAWAGFVGLVAPRVVALLTQSAIRHSPNLVMDDEAVLCKQPSEREPHAYIHVENSPDREASIQ